MAKFPQSVFLHLFQGKRPVLEVLRHQVEVKYHLENVILGNCTFQMLSGIELKSK